MCYAWMTHAQSHASFTDWRRTNRRKTRRAILLFVLSTKTTTERFLLKLGQRNVSCIELTVQQGNPKHTEYSLRIIYRLAHKSSFWARSATVSAKTKRTTLRKSRSFIIYSLKRAISGLIFILLLLFYYWTKIKLGVLLALLYKRPVPIDRQNFSFY